MKALVTGAAGFIGSHVCRALCADGHEVRALHLPGDDLRNLAGLPVERRAGDVRDREGLRAAAAGCDWVFHLAAIYALWTDAPERMIEVNVEGTRRVLEAARDAGVARVVVTSSIASFGGQGKGARATEESPFRLGATGDLYSRTKRQAHDVAVELARELDIVLVAPTGPLGPGDVGPTPTGRLLLSAVTLPLAVVTDTVSNFGDVRDIARGHVLAAERGRRGEAYLLGNQDVALTDLARMAQRAAGRHRPIVVAPFPAARLAARAALAVADHVTHRPPLFTPAAIAISELGLAADCSKAFRELGLPRRPVEQSVRDALAWFAREGYVRAPSLRRRLAAWAPS